MADINKLVPIIFGWEGTWANDPVDKGGATMMGITLDTWKSCGYDKDGDGYIDVNDLKLIDKADVVYQILKPHYWDRWKADRIICQPLANILVDWVWASGKWGIVIPQRIMDLDDDGIVGNATLSKVNNCNCQVLFNDIKNARIKFVNDLCLRDQSQKKFLQGWLNRINSFKYNR